MTESRPSHTEESSLARDAFSAFRYYVGVRRGLLFAAVAIVSTSLALKWDALVAAGVAPILVGILPCAVMCGLGLCMGRVTGKSCSTRSQDEEE
jgi:hypothetical protein